MSLNRVQTDRAASVRPTSEMSQHENNPSQRSIPRKMPLSFAGWNKPGWGLFLLLVFVGNVLVAAGSWVVVGFVLG